jgi:hypothetical protein
MNNMKQKEIVRTIEALVMLSENLELRGVPNKELQEAVDLKLKELIPLVNKGTINFTNN